MLNKWRYSFSRSIFRLSDCKLIGFSEADLDHVVAIRCEVGTSKISTCYDVGKLKKSMIGLSNFWLWGRNFSLNTENLYFPFNWKRDLEEELFICVAKKAKWFSINIWLWLLAFQIICQLFDFQLETFDLLLTACWLITSKCLFHSNRRAAYLRWESIG